ncbi:MAG TPA: cobalamin-dependent protein [Pseudonocardiaceae bacterium]|jgi:methylaspartate mutase sigma subunit|nr:cobalamin-dependent protein [Pseudonocardiaceae bacterium]
MELATCAAKDVVVSSVRSDSHTWNLVYLQLALEELGHRVANLGACVPDELLLAECRQRRPDLVVLSTVNGLGFQDGRRVIRLLRSVPELVATPIVIGGKLGIAGADPVRSATLVDAGFDAVFEDDVDITEFDAYVTRVLDRVAV